MPMEAKGLVKVTEECGELTQIAMKQIAVGLDKDEHWDGQGSLRIRLQNEIADVLAASHFVIEKFDLDVETINRRIRAKKKLFRQWDNDEKPCTCPTECDCQRPPTHISNFCPIHNDNPYPADDCPVHGEN